MGLKRSVSSLWREQDMPNISNILFQGKHFIYRDFRFFLLIFSGFPLYNWSVFLKNSHQTYHQTSMSKNNFGYPTLGKMWDTLQWHGSIEDFFLRLMNRLCITVWIIQTTSGVLSLVWRELLKLLILLGNISKAHPPSTSMPLPYLGIPFHTIKHPTWESCRG